METGDDPDDDALAEVQILIDRLSVMLDDHDPTAALTMDDHGNLSLCIARPGLADITALVDGIDFRELLPRMSTLTPVMIADLDEILCDDTGCTRAEEWKMTPPEERLPLGTGNVIATVAVRSITGLSDPLRQPPPQPGGGCRYVPAPPPAPSQHALADGTW